MYPNAIVASITDKTGDPQQQHQINKMNNPAIAPTIIDQTSAAIKYTDSWELINDTKALNFKNIFMSIFLKWL